MQLESKSAVVTGAAGGVGRASALHFAEEGARVICVDINEEAATETAGLIEEAGGSAVALACDVSKEEDVAAVIAAAVEREGRLDIMFNNVGIPTPRLGATLEHHSWEDYRRHCAVNFGGVFNGCKLAVVQFKSQGGGGVILNTGSVAGLVSWGGAVYGATKGAVNQLTKAVVIEAAPFDIRCNAICPAGMPFANFFAAGGRPPQTREEQKQAAASVGASHPLGRPITAEDCAAAAVFLCSEGAVNITGVLLPIDGGYIAR
jgi:NAD(P)-dependent dehydrogenase (short-subunit alcohol dehydrogenase family)